MPDELAQNPPETSSERLLAAVGALGEWLKSNPSEEKPHRVLQAMVAETEKKLRAGLADLRLSADEIRAATGADGGDAAAKKWIDWPNVERYWSSRHDQFLVTGVDGEASVARPVRISTRGGPGNVATYRLELAEVAQEPAATSFSNSNITYAREAGGVVRPALLVRWLFRNGEFRVGSIRSWALFTTVLLVLAVPVTLLLLTVLFLTSRATPVTTFHLSVLIAGPAMIWMAWHQVVRPWMRTFDDRIAVAEDLLAVGQKPAQVEVYRQGDERFVRLVRYTSTCSICGSGVYLADGEGDFPRRVVGRCSESPREHVFSFDRVTLRGAVLRAGGFELERVSGVR